MKLELTPNEVQVVTGILGGYIADNENDERLTDEVKSARSVFTKLLDKGCPDVLCEDCTKDCEMKKIMEQANEGLDLDKIAEEVEQDIKKQSEEVTIASVWEKRDELPFKLKISEIYTEGNSTVKKNAEEIEK